MTARIGAITAAVPAPVTQRDIWDGHFRQRYSDVRRAQLWHAAGVHTRHAVADPCTEDVSNWSTERRMRRFADEALPLATTAVRQALQRAAVDPGDVELLAVVSCTGYGTPGVDIDVARELSLSESLQRVVIGHMGCYAALPGLAAVRDAVVARGVTAVMVCVELPSLHVQPDNGTDQVVAHALFGDAAAAVVVGPSGPGLEVVDIAARTDTSHHRDITWDVTDLGFRMGLSPRVPAVLARHVRPMVDDLLARHGLHVGDVRGWAIHPGGPRILDVCADRLGLDDRAMRASRATLRDFGNCSSATVLLVLAALQRSECVAAGEHVVALAFGPGLTLYAALLRAEDGAPGLSTRSTGLAAGGAGARRGIER